MRIKVKVGNTLAYFELNEKEIKCNIEVLRNSRTVGQKDIQH